MADTKNCKFCGAKPEHQTKIIALQVVSPSERGLPLSEGPWRVIPSGKLPYRFAVVGKNDVAVAYTHGLQTAEAYAAQMNIQGYIEVY